MLKFVLCLLTAASTLNCNEDVFPCLEAAAASNNFVELQALVDKHVLAEPSDMKVKKAEELLRNSF